MDGFRPSVSVSVSVSISNPNPNANTNADTNRGGVAESDSEDSVESDSVWRPKSLLFTPYSPQSKSQSQSLSHSHSHSQSLRVVVRRPVSPFSLLNFKHILAAHCLFLLKFLSFFTDTLFFKLLVFFCKCIYTFIFIYISCIHHSHHQLTQHTQLLI